MNWRRLGAIERGGERDLDAELIRAMGFAFANAFDLGRVQGIDLLSALMLTLRAHPAGEDQRIGEDALPFGVALDLAHDVARDPAEIDSIVFSARWARLNCLACA